MLEEIVARSLHKSRGEIEKIQYISGIDFFDFFPKSEKQKLEMEQEAEDLATLIERNVRGNFYKFNKPLKTIFGEFVYFKVRWVDETKFAYDGAPDFVVEDFKKFESLYKGNKLFEFVEQKNSPAYKGFKYQSKTTWACFLDTPISDSFER